ncbi:unnamed protein product [Closterium sp. NIES-53]
MALRPSSVPLRVPLPPPPTSSLPAVPDPESDLACVASPTVHRLLAIVVTDPLFESTAASALVAKHVYFAAAFRLNYATSLVAESEQEDFQYLAAAVPHLVAMLLTPKGDPDAPDIPTLRSYAEAITGPYSSQWQTAMDPEMTSWKMTTPQWSLRRPVNGLRQAPREWHDTLRTTLAALGFAPSTADPSLFLRTDPSLPPFYVLVYVKDLVFATAYSEALALGRSYRRDTPALTWVVQRFGFRYSSPLSTALRTGQSLSAPPSNESIGPSGLYPELVGYLMYLITCTRPALPTLLASWHTITSGMGLVLGGRGLVVLTRHAGAFWVDDLSTQRSSNCEVEIYAGAMAAQELRWLTYLVTDLGERPRSSPVLYVDNKTMIALC